MGWLVIFLGNINFFSFIFIAQKYLSEVFNMVHIKKFGDINPFLVVIVNEMNVTGRDRKTSLEFCDV